MIEDLLVQIYNRTKPNFKTIRRDHISDGEEHVEYHDDDPVFYSAETYYPEEVATIITAKVSPKKFSETLSDELWVIDPKAMAHKVASDKSVLTYAGREALPEVLKQWFKKYGEEPDTESELADHAIEYAEQESDVEMDSNPKLPEILYVPDLKIKAKNASLKLEAIAPWKFRATVSYSLQARFSWPGDYDYDDKY